MVVLVLVKTDVVFARLLLLYGVAAIHTVHLIPHIDRAISNNCPCIIQSKCVTRRILSGILGGIPDLNAYTLKIPQLFVVLKDRFISIDKLLVVPDLLFEVLLLLLFEHGLEDSVA